MTETQTNNFDLNKLEAIISREVVPFASAVDENGDYPRTSLDALG